MTTIEVTANYFALEMVEGTKFSAERREPDAFYPDPAWRVNAGPQEGFVFYDREVLVLPPPRHLSFYDPQHPGELEPDAYDRMRYKYNEYGRHLLHTGTE
jgi:hypothetical protein